MLSAVGSGVVLPFQPSGAQSINRLTPEEQDALALEALAKKAQAGRDEAIEKILKNSGVDPINQPARLANVRGIQRAVIQDLLEKWREGSTEGQGFYGGPGTGKSWAAAALLRGIVGLRYDHLAKTGLVCGPWPIWINWSRELSNLKNLLRDGGPGYGNRVDALCEAPLLVIDDLGVERAGEDTWATELLYEIVDSRHSNLKRIVWTSNLDPDQLAQRYRKRLISRLQQAAPAIALSGPDRRD